jgi:hypothetical protein
MKLNYTTDDLECAGPTLLEKLEEELVRLIDEWFDTSSLETRGKIAGVAYAIAMLRHSPQSSAELAHNVNQTQQHWITFVVKMRLQRDKIRKRREESESENNSSPCT